MLVLTVMKKTSNGWHSESLKDEGRKFGVSHVGGWNEVVMGFGLGS